MTSRSHIDGPSRDEVVPLIEETARVTTRNKVTGRVRVGMTTDVVQKLAQAELQSDAVHVTRVPIDREVIEIPQVRTEGNTVIVPVLEEVLVVEKRLVLKEELHITRTVQTETVEVPVELRKQRATVERIPEDIAPPSPRGDELMTLSTETGSYGSRTITAFFDSRADAEDAVSRLKALGLPQDSVRLVPGYERDVDTASNTIQDRPGEGFWDSLRDLFLPDEDRDTYAEGLRRGGFLVTANVSDDWYDRALDILDDEGTIDIDERVESWRSEGWAGRTHVNSLPSETSLPLTSSEQTDSLAGTVGASSEATTATTNALDRGEEVIPVVEENLRVGKRDVSHGRVRVRSYVVETPVSEQVNLREEHVHVERRLVDRALTDGDVAFQDRTIEAEERAEEAVVSKEARVKEELVIRKDIDQRTETVSDTVRSTEVKIEDERREAADRSGTTDKR